MHLYSCHLPKTGGTSVLYAIRENYGQNKIFKIGKRSLNIHNKDFIEFCLGDKISNFDLGDYSHVSGHGNDSILLTFLDYDPNKFKTYLIIRDPISLFWSQYYQFTGRTNKEATPESFLKDRGPSHTLDFYKKKFIALLGKNEKFKINNFLKLFNFIFETKDITNSLSKIDPSLENLIKTKRRVRKEIKGFVPHPLQFDDSFNKEVLSFKDEDNKFFEECKASIKDDLYSNASFDQKFLENSIDNLKINYSKEDVRDFFREKVFKIVLRKKYKEFNNQEKDKWNKELDKFNMNLDNFK